MKTIWAINLEFFIKYCICFCNPLIHYWYFITNVDCKIVTEKSYETLFFIYDEIKSHQLKLHPLFSAHIRNSWEFMFNYSVYLVMDPGKCESTFAHLSNQPDAQSAWNCSYFLPILYIYIFDIRQNPERFVCYKEWLQQDLCCFLPG